MVPPKGLCDRKKNFSTLLWRLVGSRKTGSGVDSSAQRQRGIVAPVAARMGAMQQQEQQRRGQRQGPRRGRHGVGNSCESRGDSRKNDVEGDAARQGRRG